MGCRGLHPTGGGGSTRENASCTRPLARGSVGLALGRWARWLYLFRPGGRPDVVPTKNPGCLHHSRWRPSVFVEHFAQVWYSNGPRNEPPIIFSRRSSPHLPRFHWYILHDLCFDILQRVPSILRNAVVVTNPRRAQDGHTPHRVSHPKMVILSRCVVPPSQVRAWQEEKWGVRNGTMEHRQGLMNGLQACLAV